MCDDCFTAEVKSFPDEKSWTSFDLELTKKFGQRKMRDFKFVRDMWRDKDDGEYIYECLACGEQWKLRDPDNAFRGYFLRVSTIDTKTKRLTIGQILGLVFLGLVIVRIIYELVTS